MASWEFFNVILYWSHSCMIQYFPQGWHHLLRIHNQINTTLQAMKTRSGTNICHNKWIWTKHKKLKPIHQELSGSAVLNPTYMHWEERVLSLINHQEEFTKLQTTHYTFYTQVYFTMFLSFLLAHYFPLISNISYPFIIYMNHYLYNLYLVRSLIITATNWRMYEKLLN